mmetsp:Transcript_31350/g.62148  ORF Transcript_31350/g.62148 Transcript_31350/m.62148 type:complete len:92 (+) Transcript_31350:64-339(+)
MLNFLGEVADADGVQGFLETAGARNCGFYQTGGFEVVAKSPCAGFTHEGGGVGMRRKARSAPTTTTALISVELSQADSRWQTTSSTYGSGK